MRKILLASVFIILTFNTFAQIDTAALSAKLEQAKTKLGKHIAVALYKDGKIFYKKESADYNIKKQESINASSQWLTAAVVMIFVQEGKLSLDDKVSKYIPLFAKHGKSYITIRHCLTHNTGIEAGKFYQKGNFSTLEEEVNTYASKREIETNPGTEFKYSNMGSRIAARVIEIIGKRAFDRLAAEKLLRPLMMRGSTFTSESGNDAPDPSMGGISTAADYANFLGMILNKGMFNGKQILTEESIKTLLSLTAPSDKQKNVPAEVQGLDYAFGSWIIEKNAKGPSAFATSSLNGHWAMVDICRGYALVIFADKADKEMKKEFYMDIKQVIDKNVPACN